MEISSLVECYNRFVTKQYQKLDIVDLSQVPSYLFSDDSPLYISGWVSKLKLVQDQITIDFEGEPRKSSTKTKWMPIALLIGSVSLEILNPLLVSTARYSVVLISKDEGRPAVTALAKYHTRIMENHNLLDMADYVKLVKECISTVPVFTLPVGNFIVKSYRKPYKLSV